MAKLKRDPLVWEQLLDSEDLERDVSALFSDPDLSRLKELINPEIGSETLEEGLLAVVRQYLLTRLQHSSPDPYTAQELRLKAFQDAARSCLGAFEALRMDSGAARVFLSELCPTPTVVHGRGHEHLIELFAACGPGSPLMHLDQVLRAAIEAATAATKSPTPIGYQTFESELGKLSFPIFPKTPEKRLKDKQCLASATRVFKELWLEHSEKPFTAGKYYKDYGEFVGDAIAATYLVMHKLDSRLTQRRIATVIRELAKR